MCNACGFHCCAWDGFGKCGCNGCHDPACWDEEDEDDYVDDYEYQAPSSSFLRQLREGWAGAVVGLALLALGACVPNQGEPPTFSDLALTIAVGSAYDVLDLYVAEGDIPADGLTLINSTNAYAAASCAILLDETRTPADRYASLLIEVADERLALEQAIEGLRGSIDPLAKVAIRRATDLGRLYATQRADPAVFETPCRTAELFATSWSGRLG
jgi:hypothetical protein